MLARLALAWRILRGLTDRMPVPAAGCARCAEKDREIAYWRAREERTADALLGAKGLGPVAAPQVRRDENPMALLARGLGVTEIDSTRPRSRATVAMDGAAS